MAKTKTIKNAPILRSPVTENEQVTMVLNLGKKYNFEFVYIPALNKFQITRHDFVEEIDYFGEIILKED